MQSKWKFPTKEEFLEDYKKEADEDDIHWLHQFYTSYYSTDTIWSIMSDKTSEELAEDEREYLKERTPSEIWDECFEDFYNYFWKSMREKVPLDVVKKYMTKKDLKSLQFLQDQKVLEAI